MYFQNMQEFFTVYKITQFEKLEQINEYTGMASEHMARWSASSVTRKMQLKLEGLVTPTADEAGRHRAPTHCRSEGVLFFGQQFGNCLHGQTPTFPNAPMPLLHV